MRRCTVRWNAKRCRLGKYVFQVEVGGLTLVTKPGKSCNNAVFADMPKLRIDAQDHAVLRAVRMAKMESSHFRYLAFKLEMKLYTVYLHVTFVMNIDFNLEYRCLCTLDMSFIAASFP